MAEVSTEPVSCTADLLPNPPPWQQHPSSCSAASPGKSEGASVAVGSTATVASSSSDLAQAPLEALIEDGARQRVCGGKVLLRVRLACDEVAWVTEPGPLFLLAHRISYLPFFFSEVYESFKSFIPPVLGQSYEIWFDYDGVPLRWHYPLGALMDVLVGPDVAMPLDLTVHFRGCPSNELLPFSGIGDLKKAVMSAFRLAVFLQQGSAAPFMRLPMKQQQQLWDAIAQSDLRACAEIQRQLLCKSLDSCRSLAIRLHLRIPPSRQHSVLLHPALAFEGQGSSAADSPPAATTVRTLLSLVLPPLLTYPSAADDAACGGVGAKDLLPGVEVVSQGLRIPLETPLYWLALNASYLDHFVHLAVRLPSAGA